MHVNTPAQPTANAINLARSLHYQNEIFLRKIETDHKEFTWEGLYNGIASSQYLNLQM